MPAQERADIRRGRYSHHIGCSGLPVGQSGVSGWRKREERDGGQFFLSSRSRVPLRHGSLSLLSCQLRMTPLRVGECAERLGPSPRLHLGRVH